jgi:hypothetical protein
MGRKTLKQGKNPESGSTEYGTVVGVARLIHERNDVFSDIDGWLTWLIAGC